jgi:hypothetical protein
MATTPFAVSNQKIKDFHRAEAINIELEKTGYRR